MYNVQDAFGLTLDTQQGEDGYSQISLRSADSSCYAYLPAKKAVSFAFALLINALPRLITEALTCPVMLERAYWIDVAVRDNWPVLMYWREYDRFPLPGSLKAHRYVRRYRHAR
jgi:hypothetical protein